MESNEVPQTNEHRTEYTLTPDEQGLINGITNQIEELQKEAQIVVKSIMRLRRLVGEGWFLESGKLTRKS